MSKRLAVCVGDVRIGGGSAVVIQSMTDTVTADVERTVAQVIELSDAGAEIVRIAVNDKDAACAVPKIKALLALRGYSTPLVGCFHYNGHELLRDVPQCAECLDKYRINPGNVGPDGMYDDNFESCVRCAIKYDKPVRIGVNYGSIDERIITTLMHDHKDELCSDPGLRRVVIRKAMVESALLSAKKAEEIGLPRNKVVLSAKASNVPDTVAVYRMLHESCKYPLHVGVTEAGTNMYGVVSTTAALSILLNEGIGDTIRASLTLAPHESRTGEVSVCRQIVQSLELKRFVPTVISCPGCGRTDANSHRCFARRIASFVESNTNVWQKKYHKHVNEIAQLKVAVMGCIVNGPGESKYADIGICVPGLGEQPCGLVFVDGRKYMTITGNNIVDEFEKILERYVEERFAD